MLQIGVIPKVIPLNLFVCDHCYVQWLSIQKSQEGLDIHVSNPVMWILFGIKAHTGFLFLTLNLLLVVVISLFLGPFSCASAGDGTYADPSDCTKFIECHGGQKYMKSCAPGLKFNPEIKACDWPQNVQCA